MKLFEILNYGREPKYEHFVLYVEEYAVHLYVRRNDESYNVLTEGRKKGSIDLGKNYSANKHETHVPSGQQHLHLYAGQKKILTMNKDGTGKDGSTGRQIPSKVIKSIQNKFPNFNIPPNGILESAPQSVRILHKFGVLKG